MKPLLNRYPCLMRSKLEMWQDGAQITLQCTATGTFMSAEGGGGGQVVVNRLAASTWETFKVNLNGPSYFPFFYLYVIYARIIHEKYCRQWVRSMPRSKKRCSDEFSQGTHGARLKEHMDFTCLTLGQNDVDMSDMLDFKVSSSWVGCIVRWF